MKGVGIFVLGFIAGIIVTIIAVSNMDYDTNVPSEPSGPSDGLYGLTEFSEKGECVPTGGIIEVFQVLKPNMALAYTDEHIERRILVLLINYDGKSYYDEQKIKIPAGKCARQIGTYQYTTKIDFDKTVPAVVIE
jgi:hypothetical protein